MSLIADIHNDMEKGAVRLITEYRARLLCDAVRLCESTSDAEDLVSRTLVKVIGNIDTLKEDGSLYNWMKSIMVNLHRNDLAHPVARGTVPVNHETLVECAGADWGTDEEILRNSDGEAVRAALRNLDPEDREILILRYYEDLSLKEIASFLNRPVGTIGRRIHVALKLLAGKLGAKMNKTRKPLAVILVAFVSLVSAAAVATLPAFEPLRATVAGWFGGDATANEEVEVFAEPRTAAVPAAVTPTEGVSETNEQFEVVKEEAKEMNKITNVIAAAVSATVLSTNIAAAESPASQPAKTAAVQGAAPVKLAAAAPVLKLNAAPGGTRVWTGATSGDWHTPTNWDPEGVPTAADDIVLAAPEVGSYAVTANVAIVVRTLTIGSDDAASGCSAKFVSGTMEMHQVLGALTVKAGGEMTHLPMRKPDTYEKASIYNGTADLYRLNLMVGSLTVETEGRIDVTSNGYNFNNVYGYGPGTEFVQKVTPANHGGTTSAGYSYGSLTSPTNCGSSARAAASGGGAVRIVSTGTIALMGDILAEGGAYAGYASGAGGSVWLTCSQLTGTGRVSVSGGQSKYGTAGSGGRIAVWLTEATDFSAWQGKLMAYGGRSTDDKATSSRAHGAAGTIYLQAAGQDIRTATVVVDNNGQSQAKAPNNRTSGYVPLQGDVGNLVVTNRGHVKVLANTELDVYGSINTRNGFTTTDADSTVRLCGGTTATLWGTNGFWRLVCEVPGKTLCFGTTEEDRLEILSGGSVCLKGEEGSWLNLRGDPVDGEWAMRVNNNVVQDNGYVSVKNSNAGYGNAALAPYSEDLKGNVNWSFARPAIPGETISWTGEVDGDWAKSDNWDLRRSVAETDDVYIPTGLSRYPTISGGVVIQNAIRIASGASLTLNGCTISVTNALVVAGRLAANGSEKIICPRTVDFTGGAFDAASSVFRFEGDDDQLVNLGQQTFNRIEIEKNTGCVTFANGWTANGLLCRSEDALTLVFESGKVYRTTGSCFLFGKKVDDAQWALVLRGTDANTPWRLNVSGHQYVTGVAVQDSLASGDMMIADASCRDLGRNENWNFGGQTEVVNAYWTGNSGDFANSNNWSTLRVPDGKTRVLVLSRSGETKSITASEAISMKELVLETEPSGKVSFRAKRAMSIGGDLTVGKDAELALDDPSGNTVGGCVLVRSGAKLTHTVQPPAATTEDDACYKLNLHVVSNMVVEADAVIDVSSKGYAPGMGPAPGPVSTAVKSPGGSHGGLSRGSAYSCYGSVFKPFTCGSGGYDNRVGYGGGVVKLVVEGTLALGGRILADGGTFAAGGSVWIDCSVLTGTGVVSAQSGTQEWWSSGGGGRIAVYVKTRDEFAGEMNASAGVATRYDAVQSGAGTVFRQGPGEQMNRGGVLSIDNRSLADGPNPSTYYKTELPMSADGKSLKAYANTTLKLSNWAWVSVTSPMRVYDLDLTTSNVTLDLGTNTLMVSSRVHKNGKDWASGVKILCQTNETTGAYGKVVWSKPGFMVFVK